MKADLDPDVFSRWFWELDNHFAGERTERIAEVYYDHLAGMDTEAFEVACRRILRTREFFPPAQAFIEPQGEGELRAEALDAWQVVREAAGNRNRAHEILEPLGQRARDALAAVGGIRQLSMTDSRQLAFARSRFVDAYRHGEDGQPKIDPGRRAGGGLAPAGEVADRTLLEEAGRDE